MSTLDTSYCAVCYRYPEDFDVKMDYIECICNVSKLNPNLVKHKVCALDFCKICSKCLHSCSCVRCYSCRTVLAKEKDLCRGCSNCDNCCKCWTCAGCRFRVTDGTASCTDCAKCELCCKCRECTACKKFSSTGEINICSDCRQCTDCCKCDESYFPSSVRVYDHPILPFHPCNPKDKVNRYIGVEIEVANSDADSGTTVSRVLNKWKSAAVHDGSLPESGYEINTAPAKGEVFEEEINAICAALKEANAHVDSSCGLHVHVDCRDLQYYDLRKVILVYSKVEDSLFRMLAKSRLDNHYCERLSKKFKDILVQKDKDWRRNLLKTTYGNEARAGRRNKYNEARYSALNIHSWFFRKTLEFRHHQGTVDAKKIINWAKICQSIINFAVSHIEKEIEEHFRLVEPDNRLPAILSEDLREYYHSRVNSFKRNAKKEKAIILESEQPELVIQEGDIIFNYGLPQTYTTGTNTIIAPINATNLTHSNNNNETEGEN